jgi:hypothetical protein
MAYQVDSLEAELVGEAHQVLEEVVHQALADGCARVSEPA